MNTEQLTQSMNTIQQELRELSEMKAWKDIGMKLLGENNNISMQIGKLTVNIENLIEQLRGQNERVDRLVDTFDARLKNQGERIGEQSTISKTQTLLIEKLTKRIDDHDTHIDELRMRGSRKLGFIIDKIIYVAIGIGVMYVLYRFGFGG